ncbi:MAG: ABC-F family ATP-binding cassette domain-containing protein, partial [Microscillaceae bacterium]|nr:ABC-F family ATP-binding cassette domain-containing protein [Microscillaceae bacterium]
LQEEFDHLGGYTIQSKAEEILEGLGFKTEELSKPLKEFSGGWRMRVMLAKLLLQKPALLLLDEPTNHLDLPSIQWIENYIHNYDGAIIVVSHDREFVNNTATSIVEVSNRQLNQYSGNYDFYLKEKKLRAEIQQSAYENQQQKIKQTEKFIERFRAKATKAKQVQSRVKELERLDRIEEVADDNMVVNFKFNCGRPSGKQVIKLEQVGKAYNDLVILKESDAVIMRGNKVALIGANGKGKSTLLRILAGTEPIQGNRELGHNVNFAFFAQHQLESLNVENEILEELKQAGTGKSETELRNVLGCFLFAGDEVFKKIKVLSGGEKSRVALAKVLISEANFLLLDEPTNHLDMQSVNILIQALQQYEGTFIVVSHDRYFISQIANTIYYIDDQQIKQYPGTYDEYEYWRLNLLKTSNQNNTQNQKNKDKDKKTKPEKSPEEKELRKKLRDLSAKLEELEMSIMQLEEEKITLEKQLSQPEIYENPDKMHQTQEKYQKINATLEQKQASWDTWALEIEELEKNLKN